MKTRQASSSIVKSFIKLNIPVIRETRKSWNRRKGFVTSVRHCIVQ